MHKDLKQEIRIPFDNIYLDPNNPRIAPDDRPGYDDASRILDKAVQQKLTQGIEKEYDLDTLEEAIVRQGWVPIDAILVWELHRHKGQFVVVEGNCRVTTLRRIRSRLVREDEKLKRMEATTKKYAKQDLEDQRDLVSRLRQIVDDTEELRVFPVNAKDPMELEERLPRLLGVRHITRAQNWSPYATNLYVLSLYQAFFEEKYGEPELRLVPDLIEQVGAKVSEGETKTRRRIQAASAFSRFRRRNEDSLPGDGEFSHEDQYFFENILQNKFPQEQFGFGRDDLHLSDEMEDVLFKWAFAAPRDEEDNPNVLRKAEDLRLWAQIKRYDDTKGTAFASELDVEQPDQATPMEKLEAKYRAHKAQVSPIDTFRAIMDSFKKIPADVLLSQSSHLRPMLKEVATTATKYLKMIESAEKD